MTRLARPPSAAVSILPRSSPESPRAWRAIQKTIQVTKPTAMIERMPPRRLLGLEGQALRSEGEQGAEGEGEHDGRGDAAPDAGEQVAAFGLDEVGDQDDDDEAGLEPLAQPDQVVAERKIAHRPLRCEVRLTYVR